MEQEPYYILEFKHKDSDVWHRSTSHSKEDCFKIEAIMHKAGLIARVIKVEEKFASF